MPATQTVTRPTRKVPSRPVTELLLEIAYRLHATRAVARPPVAGTPPFMRGER
jgi:hypothetical protein